MQMTLPGRPQGSLRLRSRRLRYLGAGLALALSAAPALALDTESPGYELLSLDMPTGTPTYGTVTATRPGGELVTFNGSSVDLWTPSGGFLQNLGVLAAGGYAAFIQVKPDDSGVVFAHSGDFFAGVDGEVFEASFTPGAGISSLASVLYGYDAVFRTGTELLISASDPGFAGNDILSLDVSTGALKTLAQVPGPSGPLDLRANGDLFYAPFPTVGTATDIVYWTAAQVASGAMLDETSWTVWSSGYDPISSLRVDPVKDRVYVAENLYDDMTFALLSARIRRARPNEAKAELIVVGDESLSNLEFVDAGGGAANFQSYQPGDGSNLKYNTTDFSSFTTHQTIAPKRSTLTASGPGLSGFGAVTLTAVDAPANGTLYLLFGPQATMSATEQTYSNPGYLFHTFLSPSSMRRLPFIIPTDANGTGSFTLFNDGSLTGLYGYQYLVGDGTATFIGSTNVTTF